MQVYRFMDIGTAKITPREMKGVKHHLIDIVNPDEDYHAAQFVDDARKAIIEIHQKGRIPLLTGGTGLYLNALKNGIFENAPSDRKIRNKLHLRVSKEGSEILHEELMACDEISAHRIHKNDKARIIRALEVYISTGKPLSEHIKEQKRTGPPCIFYYFEPGFDLQQGTTLPKNQQSNLVDGWVEL